MADPVTNNQTASIVNDILKTVIEGGGVTATEAVIIADVPWLGLPIIKQIMELILNKVAAVFYTSAANAATKLIVDIQINQEKSTVLNAFQSLQMAVASGDKDAIAKASDDLDKAYGSIIHYDGSAPA